MCNLLLVKYKKLLYNKNDCEQKEQKGKYMKGLYDIHTHIIPHVDDGADTIEITKKILQMEYNDGVRTIFSIFRFSRQQKRLHRISGSFWDASFTPIWIW